MKKLFMIAGVCALTSATLLYAQDSKSPYVSALQSAGAKCETVAYKSGLEQRLTQQKVAYGDATEDDYSSLLEKNSEIIQSCISAAKKRGIGIYKSYASKAKSKQIAKDMKDVLIAWLSYLPDRVSYAGENYDGEDPSRIEAANLKKAVSTLKVDELTQ